MANGYSQIPTGKNTNTNGGTQVGGVNFEKEEDLQEPVSYLEDAPYKKEVDPTPSPILGKIKFQKTIYSQKAFRKKIDTSIGELIPKKEEVDIEGFFKEYYKIFFDIPQKGINSHTTLINESKDFVSDYVDYKDEQISNLEKQIEDLELKLLNFDGGTGIEDLEEEINTTTNNIAIQIAIGDYDNPNIDYNYNEIYSYQGLNTTMAEYINSGHQNLYPDAARYAEGYIPTDPPTVISWNKDQLKKDFRQAFEKAYNSSDDRDNQTTRTYKEWKADIDRRSTGVESNRLKDILRRHRDAIREIYENTAA